MSRAKEWHGGILVGGANYGQGSSREHAALAPMYLGVRAVLALSLARIHWQNLINFGIVPLVISAEDYDALEQRARLRISNLPEGVRAGQVQVVDESSGRTFTARVEASGRQVEILLAGGRLNYVRAQLAEGQGGQ